MIRISSFVAILNFIVIHFVEFGAHTDWRGLHARVVLREERIACVQIWHGARQQLLDLGVPGRWYPHHHHHSFWNLGLIPIGVASMHELF